MVILRIVKRNTDQENCDDKYSMLKYNIPVYVEMRLFTKIISRKIIWYG